MKKPKTKADKEPWEFKDDDLDPTDPFYEISRPYRIWYEYLRLSPTFALAVKEYEYKYHKFTENELHIKYNDTTRLFYQERLRLLIQPELSDIEKERIPIDYSIVVNTYKEMTGNNCEFSCIDFKTWWNGHGKDIFGFRINPPPVSIINIPPNEVINNDDIMKSFNDYTSKDWIKFGYPSLELIVVPLTGNKNDIIKSLIELIKDKPFVPVKRKNKALFKLEKGKQLDKLEIGLRLIWIAALNPNLPLWKIGHKAKIFRKNEYQNMDPDLENQPKKNIENTDFMASITSKRLKEALFIMENAARGIFPCNTPFKDPKYLNYERKEILKLVRESIERRQKVDILQKKIYQWEEHLMNCLATEAKNKFNTII